MAASTAGALKAFLEAQGLGVSVYRDQAPTNTPMPYLVVTEGISVVPDPLEDGAASTCTEVAQVDVWMQWKALTGAGGLVESHSLPGAVERALHGAQLSQAPTRAYLVLVRAVGPRLLEMEDNVVKVPITVAVRRNL